MKFKNLIFILSILLTSFAVAAPIDTLNEFYQTSIDKNVDGYIATQDALFIEEQGDGFREYIKSMFDEVTILNYEILNEDVSIDEDTALIFYNLQGEFEIDGEKSTIDNDMVAFLWRYDDWKVRWTITRGLYEEKLAMGMIMDASIESMFEEASNKTVQQEMIDEGFDINIEEGEIVRTELFTYFVRFLALLFVVLIVLIVVFLKKVCPEDTKKKMDGFAEEKLKKTKNKFRDYFAFFEKRGIPVIKKGLKHSSKVVVKHSKKVYGDVKPRVRKMYNDVKPHVKKAHDGIKRRISEIKK